MSKWENVFKKLKEEDKKGNVEWFKAKYEKASASEQMLWTKIFNGVRV